jgi:hypothetical protein
VLRGKKAAPYFSDLCRMYSRVAIKAAVTKTKVKRNPLRSGSGRQPTLRKAQVNFLGGEVGRGFVSEWNEVEVCTASVGVILPRREPLICSSDGQRNAAL